MFICSSLILSISSAMLRASHDQLLKPAGSRSLLSRKEFARAAASITVTGENTGQAAPTRGAATEAQIRRSLGEPDDVVTPDDPGGPPEGERELRYGTNGHLTFATLGSVRIDRQG